MEIVPTNIGVNVKTPSARTAAGINGDAGKNVTPIHKPLNSTNYTSSPTAGMEKAVGKLNKLIAAHGESQEYNAELNSKGKAVINHINVDQTRMRGSNRKVAKQVIQIKRYGK